MANVNPAATMGEYLNNVLHFGAAPLRNTVIAQGLDDIDLLRHMDTKMLVSVVRNVRTPGGTIPNPQAAAGNAHPARIRNYGLTISARQELLLRQMVFFAQYIYLVQRFWNDPTQAELARVWATKLTDDAGAPAAASNPLPPPLTSIKGIRASLEAIADHLNSTTGADGIPMSYLTRPHVSLLIPLVPAGAQPVPPAYSHPGSPTTHPIDRSKDPEQAIHIIHTHATS